MIYIKHSSIYQELKDLRWSIFKQYLTPRKTWTIIKHLFCRKYTLLYAVIMCFIIISQVQSKNNKQWNKVTNSTGEQFECDQCFSVDFEILIQNRLICKPYQQWNEVNILILIFTVPSNLLVRKVIGETWLTPSYNNTGHAKHAILTGTTNGEILTCQVKREHVDVDQMTDYWLQLFVCLIYARTLLKIIEFSFILVSSFPNSHVSIDYLPCLSHYEYIQTLNPYG